MKSIRIVGLHTTPGPLGRALHQKVGCGGVVRPPSTRSGQASTSLRAGRLTTNGAINQPFALSRCHRHRIEESTSKGMKVLFIHPLRGTKRSARGLVD